VSHVCNSRSVWTPRVYGACFEQQLPPFMTASLPAVDRPTPTVAIVGTDAVLAAAPATPVQIAHACLRRGFTVAVPASWGDELVAAETARQLTTRDRGPAVMCVCPFVRARLLGPGADLAPFLVSLVSPPVAVARYLRSAYGERGVHVTYIGACPGADDPSIDARLTPDAFIADLAERGIALSEQPLVFDSIVPPDRRRWCSLPGGVPNPEVLAGETDGRILIEIERDDVTAELAQHIIAREHVLLDLAPGLGCACSGAIGLVSPNRARAAVAAAEPPRALSPVIDSGATVSLNIPVLPPTTRHASTPRSIVSTVVPDTTMERVLDELLGTGAASDDEQRGSPAEIVGASAVIVDLPPLPPVPVDYVIDAPPVIAPGDTDRDTASSSPDDETDRATAMGIGPAADIEVESAVETEPSVIETSDPATVVDEPDGFVLGNDVSTHEPGSNVSATVPASPEPAVDEPIAPIGSVEATDAVESHVRRRTPPAMLRYPSTSVPKTTVANGRPLPRAYVAKRRTPPAGAMTISATPAIGSASPVAPGTTELAAPAVSPPSLLDDASAQIVGSVDAGSGVTNEPVSGATTVVEGSISAASVRSVLPRRAAVDGTIASHAAANSASNALSASTQPGASTAPPAAAVESTTGDTRAAARSANHPALVFLLVTALVGLAVFVLLMLRR
jgi:hypothetical protein